MTSGIQRIFDTSARELRVFEPVREGHVSIYLCGEGHYDSVPVEDVRRFDGELLSHLHHAAAGVYESIAGGKVLEKDQAEILVAETNRFKQSFLASDGSRVVNEAEAGALPAEDVEHETIKVKRNG